VGYWTSVLAGIIRGKESSILPSDEVVCFEVVRVALQCIVDP